MSTMFAVPKDTDTPNTEGETPTGSESDLNRQKERKLVTLDELDTWELNPRKNRTRAHIKKIADSMGKDGQDDDVIVRPHPDLEKRAQGIWQIIDGETRKIAAGPNWLDWRQLRIEIRRDLDDDQDALDFAWRHNDKRERMSALDYAYYVQSKLIAAGGEENPDSYRVVARGMGVSYQTVANYAHILQLEPAMRAAFAPMTDDQGQVIVEEGDHTQAQEEAEEYGLGLNEKHGRALWSLRDYPDAQEKLFEVIQKERISGSAAVNRAAKMKKAIDEPKEPKPPKAPKEEKPPAAPPTDPPTGDGTPPSPPAPEFKETPTEAAIAAGGPDDDPTPTDDWRPENGAQRAGQGGVGNSAPVSQGSGFATATPGGQNLHGIENAPGTYKKDWIEDELRPQVEATYSVVTSIVSRQLNDDEIKRTRALEKRLRDMADMLHSNLQQMEVE